ncbi:hypothetical protein [Azospirillum argentinense]
MKKLMSAEPLLAEPPDACAAAGAAANRTAADSAAPIPDPKMLRTMDALPCFVVQTMVDRGRRSGWLYSRIPSARCSAAWPIPLFSPSDAARIPYGLWRRRHGGPPSEFNTNFEPFYPHNDEKLRSTRNNNESKHARTHAIVINALNIQRLIRRLLIAH